MFDVLKKLSDRPIAFHRAYVTLTGSLASALMLSQSVYWSMRTENREGWFYKTQKEWEEETGMTRWEQEGARNRLKKTGFWQEKLQGVPARLFFRVDIDLLISALCKTDKPDEVLSSNKHEEKPHTSITETTTETTATRSSPTGDGGDNPKKVDSSIEAVHEDRYTTITGKKDVTEPSKKKRAARAKIAKPVDECYPDFVAMWCEQYPDLGFNAVSGAKVKDMIKTIRDRVRASGREETKENVNATFAYVLAYVKRENHWVHGKPATTFAGQLASVMREIKEGKPTQRSMPTSSELFGKYGGRA